MKNPPSIPPEDRQTLLQIARSSIRHGLEKGQSLVIKAADYPARLQEDRATFVTLTINDMLRGCIGTLEANRPLVQDVAGNAYAAAFCDPRFPPLAEHEYDKLSIHISVLSPTEPINFNSEEALLKMIRPGIDGLVLQEGRFRGTFLPSVWEQLPDRRDFLRHLKLKAGLRPDYWSDTIEIQRYTTEIIE